MPWLGGGQGKHDSEKLCEIFRLYRIAGAGLGARSPYSRQATGVLAQRALPPRICTLTLIVILSSVWILVLLQAATRNVRSTLSQIWTKCEEVISEPCKKPPQPPPQ